MISAITAVQSIVRVPVDAAADTLPVALAVVGLVPCIPCPALASFAPCRTAVNAPLGEYHIYDSVNIAELIVVGLLAGVNVVLQPAF
jgi:hypothetical protein